MRERQCFSLKTLETEETKDREEKTEELGREREKKRKGGGGTFGFPLPLLNRKTDRGIERDESVYFFLVLCLYIHIDFLSLDCSQF